MVQLQPSEYEALVAALGEIDLDDLQGRCATTEVFWVTLRRELGARRVAEILTDAHRRKEAT